MSSTTERKAEPMPKPPVALFKKASRPEIIHMRIRNDSRTLCANLRTITTDAYDIEKMHRKYGKIDEKKEKICDLCEDMYVTIWADAEDD